MRIFFQSPDKKYHIREIARITGLSPSGVMKIVSRLKGEGLLVTRKENMVENVIAERNEKFINMKKCFNMLVLHESGLIEYLRDKYEEPEAIVLFGSYARGEDNSKSDIDMAVVTKDESQYKLTDFERKLNRKINLYAVEISECKKEFLNNLANGIVLYGHLRILQ